MNVNDFVRQQQNIKSIGDIEKIIYYDKKLLMMIYLTNYEIVKKTLIKTTSFFIIKDDEKIRNTETLYNYEIKTNLYKYYLCVLKLDDKTKNKLIKKDNLNLIYQNKVESKNIKDSYINYLKENENEYIKRDLNKIFDLIRTKAEEQIKKIDNYINKNLSKNENLIMALNEIKPRNKNLFIKKFIDSKEQYQKDNIKIYLKWTKSANYKLIKGSIKFILNNDTQKGFNGEFNDYIYLLNLNKSKWDTKFYFRDLYLELFNKYLAETNGEQETAKKLAIQEIESKHRKPK